MSEQTLLVGPATVITNDAARMVLGDAGVVCRHGRIAEVGAWSGLRARHAAAQWLDAAGRVVLPGLVNAHHHLYSTFARGMPIAPGTPLHDFPHILEGIWWRLDRALGLDQVEAGAWPPLMDCLRWGTTTIVDHHASPEAIGGSLDALARACGQAGVRACLCYEITDRNGVRGAQQGIEENATFATRSSGQLRLTALLGLHASFTVSDSTLEAAARAVPADLPIHVHVAEDAADIERTQASYQATILDRLQHCGLLRKGSLLVHGVHLGDTELRQVASSGAWLVHNPESNANNAVGQLDVLRAMQLGVRVALGTDGMASSMLRAAKSAYLTARNLRRDPTVGMELPRKLLLDANMQIARERFGDPTIGTVTAGAPADLCVLDYDPPTPLRDDTFDGHLVFGMTEAPVLATVSDGRVRWNRGVFPGLDEGAIRRRVDDAAQAVWSKLP
jgi:putative selenium metabolism protein SsnA